MSLQGPVLVPLDGSELAERAVPVAVELVRRGGAELRLVHVHTAITAEPIHVEGLPVIDEQMRSLRSQHEQAYLERASRRLAGGVRVSVDLLDGPVATTLAAHAESCRAGLIVMTTHGRGGFERLWMGSVADEIVRVSRVPLLLVRPEPGPGPGPLRRILVPLDGSSLAEGILEHATRLALLAEGELVLLAVVLLRAPVAWVPDPALAAALPEEDVVGERKRAQEYLEGVAVRLAATGVGVRTRVEIGAAVTPAILDVARAEQADAVALATHGRSGLVRLALGSVADKVVRASRTPVLLFRPAPFPSR
jgi:nucleotide-binding universal stress UspA family protein